MLSQPARPRAQENLHSRSCRAIDAKSEKREFTFTHIQLGICREACALPGRCGPLLPEVAEGAWVGNSGTASSRPLYAFEPGTRRIPRETPFRQKTKLIDPRDRELPNGITRAKTHPGGLATPACAFGSGACARPFPLSAGSVRASGQNTHPPVRVYRHSRPQVRSAS